MLFRVRVSAERRDEVQDPTKHPARAEPQSRRENQPQDPREHAPVIDLPEARKNQAKYTGNNWIAHRLNLPPTWNLIRQPREICSLALAVTIYVGDRTAEGFHQRLGIGMCLSLFPAPLFLQSLFVGAAEWLAFDLRIFDDDADAHLLAGSLVARLADELHVLRSEEHTSELQ